MDFTVLDRPVSDPVTKFDNELARRSRSLIWDPPQFLPRFDGPSVEELKERLQALTGEDSRTRDSIPNSKPKLSPSSVVGALDEIRVPEHGSFKAQIRTDKETGLLNWMNVMKVSNYRTEEISYPDDTHVLLTITIPLQPGDDIPRGVQFFKETATNLNSELVYYAVLKPNTVTVKKTDRDLNWNWNWNRNWNRNELELELELELERTVNQKQTEIKVKSVHSTW
ncbi:hypothetical protein HK102_013746 [Quaeritorhiza haematococci]|nr:hypothetical protein HK102_013746 [Quaeritorhiza haematococci]